MSEISKNWYVVRAAGGKEKKAKEYIERVQQPISDDAQRQFVRRVADIARVMAAGEFTARVEHHCSDPHKPGDCRLHIIPAVSRA